MGWSWGLNSYMSKVLFRESLSLRHNPPQIATRSRSMSMHACDTDAYSATLRRLRVFSKADLGFYGGPLAEQFRSGAQELRKDSADKLREVVHLLQSSSNPQAEGWGSFWFS